MGFPGVFDYWNGVLLTTCRKEGTRKDIVTLLLQFGPSPGMILQILSWKYYVCKRVGQRMICLYYWSTFILGAGPVCDGGSHWNFDWVRILARYELEEFIEGLSVLVSVVCKDVHKVRRHPSVNNTSSTFFCLKWAVCNSICIFWATWKLFESLSICFTECETILYLVWG